MYYSVFDEEKKLKSRVLSCLFIVVGGLALILSGVNWFIHENDLFSLALAGFSACSLGLLFRQLDSQLSWETTKKDDYCFDQRIVEVYIFYLSGLVVWGCIISRIDSGLLFWTLLLSSIYYFLLGLRQGAKWSGVLLLAISSLMYWKLQFGQFNPNMIVNYVASFVSIWAISHYYEKHRQISTNGLKRLALRDPLTSTLNRLALEQDFARYIQGDDSVHLIAFDIDYFKKVNDTYGHLAGDSVLKQVASRLQTIAGDSTVYRLGGEEFCVLVTNHSPQEVASMAETIRKDIADVPFEVDGLEIALSTSAGIAKSQQTRSLDTLSREADELLYQAKLAGRNRVYMAR
ncbi:GGDEF domain-containing protein [Photobacterium sp. BZF1]|uniref:GGDEF domain-containing protein n=1 Tax=Photobacterium sp. BZF1 TaxID=1904457 RepID=UPI001653ADB3|nr:GGDEF domain-containing protein [Photobacterium sp. BZF1]MBC7006194.1 GGDEF domain-containing protein [Photobacterium sp. BZF1]